jgi:UDP-sugar pyrophosphorylase
VAAAAHLVLLLLAQVRKLHDTCPGEGGLLGYAQRARKLLADSAEGVNSLDGWSPSIPQGERLEPGTPHFEKFEQEGTPEIGACGFVLVAGGLGERLGYSDIKVR